MAKISNNPSKYKTRSSLSRNRRFECGDKLPQLRTNEEKEKLIKEASKAIKYGRFISLTA